MKIREAASHQELDEVTLIQREVWNLADIEIIGRIHLRASQHAGGSVLIAVTDDGGIAGFAYAFPAFVDGEAYWHSDMLAVRPSHRETGVGRDLKWAQREQALARGVRRITWTFDPMQAKNAHLNLEHLGVTVREYLSDFYGVTTSALHHGLPTDRLLASWDLESARVAALARGERGTRAAGSTIVSVPPSWNALVESDPALARTEQKRVGREVQAALAQSLVITGFDKEASAYVLGPERD